MIDQVAVTETMLADAVLDLAEFMEDATAPPEAFGHQLAVALRRARGIREPRPLPRKSRAVNRF